MHFKGSLVEEDGTKLSEGVMFKIDGYAEKAVNDQLYHRTTDTSKAFLEAMNPADKVLKVTGGNTMNSVGYRCRCPYWPLDFGNSEAELKDYLEKEVVPAIMETKMMRRDSSFAVKSYSVVNHMTDVVDYNDDLRHVIRHYLADECDFQEENFIELHYVKDLLPGYFWIFPLADGWANVGLGMLTKDLSRLKVNLKSKLEEIVREHPTISPRFAQAEKVGKTLGFGLPLGSKQRPISGERMMLVGDAASLIDPFTGEGIGNDTDNRPKTRGEKQTKESRDELSAF